MAKTKVRENDWDVIEETKMFHGLVTRTRNRKGDYHYRYPTLCVCPQCHGYTDHTGAEVEGYTKAELAYHIALMQWGQSNQRWSNFPPEAGVCECSSELEKVRLKVKDLPIMTDSGWSGQKVGRCIMMHRRVVSFDRPITEDELSDFVLFLKLDKCPGWTGIYCTKLSTGDVRYEFVTSWDSSD